MNKNTGIIVGVIIIILIAIGFSGFRNSENKEMLEDQAMMENETDGMMNEENMTQEDVTSMMTAGSYEPYNAEKIARAETENVVLFFRASWCPTCRAVDTDIKANLSQIPSDLVILDVDYDNSSELKKKYGVTYQHTFVQVDKEGNLIKKWSGSPTLLSLVSEIE